MTNKAKNTKWLDVMCDPVATREIERRRIKAYWRWLKFIFGNDDRFKHHFEEQPLTCETDTSVPPDAQEPEVR